MTKILHHLIAGRWVDAPVEGDSRNPSDISEVVAEVPVAGLDDVDEAVTAAALALPGWASASPEFRADILDRAGSLILERREMLGELLARGGQDACGSDR